MKTEDWVVVLGLVSLSVATSGCEGKKKGSAAAASASAEVAEKPKVGKGGACKENSDCIDAHGCAPDGTCQTYKTIECRGRDTACKKEGRCTGTPSGCVAATDDDCKMSEACKVQGRCSAHEDKCVAKGNEDCQALCLKEGRCTMEGGKCIAASDDDCKQSEICKSYKKCMARNGLCFKKTKN